MGRTLSGTVSALLLLILATALPSRAWTDAQCKALGHGANYACNFASVYADTGKAIRLSLLQCSSLSAFNLFVFVSVAALTVELLQVARAGTSNLSPDLFHAV